MVYLIAIHRRYLAAVSSRKGLCSANCAIGERRGSLSDMATRPSDLPIYGNGVYRPQSARMGDDWGVSDPTPYKETFPVGTLVRVADRHNHDHSRHAPLGFTIIDFQPEQLTYADRATTVQDVGFYHGGEPGVHVAGILGVLARTIPGFEPIRDPGEQPKRNSAVSPDTNDSLSRNGVYRPEPTTSHQRGRSVEWICGPTPPWRRKRRSSFETEFCNGPGSKTEARDNPILLCVETEIRGAENPDSRSSGGCLKTCPLHTVKAVRAG